MKRTGHLAIGFVSGIVATLLVLYASFNLFCSSMLQSETNKSIKLGIHDMLILTSRDSSVLIDFLSYGKDGSQSTYRWRASLPEQMEQSGSGTVFEAHTRIRTGPNIFFLKDKGSQLNIHAGPVTVEWSYGSADTGWIYYDPEKQRVEIISDSQFESYVFGKEAQHAPPAGRGEAPRP